MTVQCQHNLQNCFSLCIIVFQMTVIQGDLVKIAADSIVHPTSSNFYMGGEVGRSLITAHVSGNIGHLVVF